MHYHPGKMAATMTCLFYIMLLGVCSDAVSAKNRPVRTMASAQIAAKSSQLEQLEVIHLKKAINFYRNAAWQQQDKALTPRTPTSYPERRISSPGYLRWRVHFWMDHWHTAKKYVSSHPWVRLVRRTNRYRQCIITVESRTSGLYHAYNSASRASGAYQFLDSTWVGVVRKFEQYYHRRITTAKRAIDAPARVQDTIAAYAIVAQHGQPWTECRDNRA
jgi:hypothetical protein